MESYREFMGRAITRKNAEELCKDITNENESEVTVFHQQTCPECRRKMVNVYKKGTIRKCKKCWDKHK
jgi:ribosomal protein L37AE/L43A